MKRVLWAVWVAVAVGCGPGDAPRAGGGRPGGSGAGPGGRPGGPAPAAVPVEVAVVERRTLASFLETNGTLEAENEVDLVARTSGPIVELTTEENRRVARGDLLARIDPEPSRAALEVARVELDDALAAWERVEALREASLVSQEEHDQARARLDAAEAQHSGRQLDLEHTEIRAPFTGLIVRRYVRFAESVGVGQALFRLSDFTPLLCRIQVPERELSRLAVGQEAHLTVEAWPGERFGARVLRVSPVVEADTGTIRVTLEADGRDRLRPGMFASVFVQTESREGALAVPSSALILDSVRDAVFVVDGETAARREVALGVRQGGTVEVVRGLEPGERVVTVGQDALSHGMAVRVMTADGESPVGPPADREAGG